MRRQFPWQAQTLGSDFLWKCRQNMVFKTSIKHHHKTRNLFYLQNASERNTICLTCIFITSWQPITMGLLHRCYNFAYEQKLQPTLETKDGLSVQFTPSQPTSSFRQMLKTHKISENSSLLRCLQQIAVNHFQWLSFLKETCHSYNTTPNLGASNHNYNPA